MSNVSILDHRGGVLKTLHTDPHAEGRMVEVMTQDVDPVLAHAAKLRELRGTRTQDFLDGMVVAGFIPDVVVERMMRDGSFNDEAALKRWLNDPANEGFRVWKGKV
jgi:hypothetical protein